MTDKLDKKEDESDKTDLEKTNQELIENDTTNAEKDTKEKVEDVEAEIKDDELEAEENGAKRKLKGSHKVILSLIFIFILTSGFTIYHFNKVLTDERIYEGIKVDNIDIGGKNKKEALEAIKKVKEKELDGSKMDLTYGDKVYDIKIKDLGFKYDYEKAVNDAYNTARKGKNFDRLREIRALKEKNKNIELESSYDAVKAKTVVEPIKEDINKEKIEATFNFNGGNPIITEEQVGYKINEEKLTELVNNNIYKLEPIEIPVEKINPVVTKAALGRINGVIGEFTSNFPNSIAGRKENIKISSKAVSDRGVIMPGETVSFNQLTGDRSRANGYKEAIVIEEGSYTDGLGGGVCQTSTTLYNALLRADVSVVSRGPHSIPASYVPYGQDAAVAYDYLDLKYRNDFDFPIYIHSNYTGSSVTFKVYGDKNVKNYGVKIDSEIVETLGFETETVEDKSLAPGSKEVVQYGRKGYKVHTFKTLVKDGKNQERKLITKDFYKPKNTVYRVGPKTE